MVDLNTIEPMKLQSDAHIATIDMATLNMVSDIKDIMKKRGIYVDFDFSGNSPISSSTEKEDSFDVSSLEERLSSLRENALFVFTGDMESYREVIDSLKKEKDSLKERLSSIDTREVYQKVVGETEKLEEKYHNLLEEWAEVFKKKIEENEGLKKSIDLEYLENLPNHALTEVRSMGNQLLRLYREDGQLSKEPENIKEAVLQNQKLSFYKASVSKIKQEVLEKEKQLSSGKEYARYEKLFTEFMDKIDLAMNVTELAVIREQVSDLIEEYNAGKASLSYEDQKKITHLATNTLKKEIEKERIFIFGNYKELEDYAKKNAVKKEQKEVDSKKTAYSENRYDYYNLNKIAEEVQRYNAPKQEKEETKYTENAYDYYNLNKIASEVASYNSEKKQDSPIHQQSSSSLDAYLKNPGLFFNQKKEDASLDPILNDAYKEKLRNYIDAQRENFEKLFTGENPVYDRTDLDRVKDVLMSANAEIERERDDYVQIHKTNPLLLFDGYKKEIQRDRSLSVEQIASLLEYVEQLRNQFMFLFIGHTATMNPNDTNLVEQYMNKVHDLIEKKKESVFLEDTHTRTM